MATVILMIDLDRKGTIFGQVLIQSQVKGLAENITAGMIRIDTGAVPCCRLPARTYSPACHCS